MRYLFNFSICSVAAMAFVSSVQAVDLSKLPPVSKQENVTFDKDIKPLFQASCVRCHSGEKPKGGLHLDTREGVIKGGKDGKVIEIGKSEKSDLVISIAQLDPQTAMPPKPRNRRGPGGSGPGPGNEAGTNTAGLPPQGMAATNGPAGGKMAPPKPLTAEQVGLVRAWVDQGAK